MVANVMLKNLLCLFLLSFIGACAPQKPYEYEALVYKQPRQIKPFKLVDQYNVEVTEQDLKDQWVLIFLGYTSCPDICPMTMAKLNRVKQALPDALNLNVWLVSIDPQRDSAENLKQYIDYFNPKFRALSGPHKQLYPFVSGIGLMYAMTSAKDDNYYVDHSASVVLVNPQGAITAIFKPEFSPEAPPSINESIMIKELKLLTQA